MPTTITARIIADSITPFTRARLTTIEVEYPRIIHSELMTHRVFSRNASSSRAIPTITMAERAENNIQFPLRWGKNQAGMQAKKEDLSPEDAAEAARIWVDMARYCAAGVKRLGELGLHKQWANRPLEWFSTIKVLITATEWDNFFNLRLHTDAQPEFEELAKQMHHAMGISTPRVIEHDINLSKNWHLPYIRPEEIERYQKSPELLAKLSSARCARVSYLTHDGEFPIIEKDLDLFNRLAGSEPLHASPLEHPASPLRDAKHVRNFIGWRQFRSIWEGWT